MSGTQPGWRSDTDPIERPARVLFLHPSDELYGSDLVLLSLLQGLDRTRFQPLVVLANDLDYEGLLSQELVASGIACRQMPLAVIRRQYFSPIGVLTFLKRLYRSTQTISRLIADEQIDIVYTNTLAVWTGALAARRTRRPHLWHVHELIERPPQLRTFLRHFVPAHATRVIGVSRAALDHLLVTPRTRSRGLVLYNGLESSKWLTTTGRERIRHELECGQNDILAGMIARISSFKAPDLFIEAASQLLPRYPQLRCFIAGGPVPGQTAMLERVQRLIATSPAPDRIRLLGFRRDTPDLMAGLDILVQPSRDPEACSMTILQAMFAGKPVVASDVGGNRELISHGETGWLIPRGDVQALVTALSTLVQDAQLRNTMGHRGQQRALAQFTLDRQIAAFNQLLWDEYLASTRHSMPASLCADPLWEDGKPQVLNRTSG